VRRPVLSLVLLSSLTFFFGLGRQAISDADEAYYAEAAREMVESGDWLTPRFNYEDRWQKPVLYYWLTAGTYRVAGVNEAAARWWSALAALGMALLAWGAALRFTGSARIAWLAGAIVATCYGCFAIARMSLPDLPLAFCITLTIWAALERRWAIAGLGAGLGFLAKGPIALVVPAIVLVPIWWRERRVAPVRMRDLAMASAVAAAVGLPWYAAMTLEHGTAYLTSFFVGDNLERFATDRFNEPRPLWFYLPIVIGGLLPWSLFMLVLPWTSIRAVLRRQRQLTATEWRLLIWASAPLLLFTISIGKQPRYILPVLPPLAILVARMIVERIETPARGARGLRIATAATSVLYGVLAVLLYRARLIFISADGTATMVAVALMGGCAVALAWVATGRRWQSLPLVATICAAALLLSVQFGALAGVRPEPVEQMAALIRAQRAGAEPVGTYQVFVRNLVFYTRFKQVDLFDEGLALDYLRSPQRVLLVVRDTDLARLEAISGIATLKLGQVRYLNAASVRLRTILSPIPGQDVETVWLVSNK
jgi:4-amino-4-deoxy-L-arabinose transferase-like glycosyltransferase